MGLIRLIGLIGPIYLMGLIGLIGLIGPFIPYFSLFPFPFFGGTGSYPLPPQGLHLSMRQMAKSKPLMGPWMMRACRAYSEQVGVKRQAGGV